MTRATSGAAVSATVREAVAEAHPNVALAKYWGKRDAALNLPAVPSLSITLAGMTSRTRVTFDAAAARDELVLNGAAAPDVLTRLQPTLERLRTLAGCTHRARVVADNDFPTAAGLASSASGFAALVVAAADALGLELAPATASAAARRGSGSAARSLFGGFVEMAPGRAPDGRDAIAQPLLAPEAWPLEVVVVTTDPAPKAVSSRDGMALTAATSPYYAAWVAGAVADFDAARAAVLARDFERLAEVAEASCLAMHAVALAARPGLLYWNGATLEAMQAVRRMRGCGHAVFFTVDAGPQVKAVCLPGHAGAVAAELGAIEGVHSTHRCGLGGDARVVERGTDHVE